MYESEKGLKPVKRSMYEAAKGLKPVKAKYVTFMVCAGWHDALTLAKLVTFAQLTKTQQSEVCYIYQNRTKPSMLHVPKRIKPSMYNLKCLKINA